MKTFYKTKSGGNTILYESADQLPIDPNDLTDDEIDNLSFVVVPGDTVMEFLEDHPSGEKIWIKVTTRAEGVDTEGWVPVEELEFSEPPEPIELYLWGFIKSCTFSARVINEDNKASGYGINRDFMIATAIVESGKSTNKPQNIDTRVGGTDLIGPFQFSEADWKVFIESPLNTDGYAEDDIRNPQSQAFGFGARAFAATKELSEALTPNDTTDADGPHVPNSIELFLHHSLGKSAAIASIKAQNEGNADSKIIEIASAADENLSADTIQKYKRFYGTVENSKTIAEAFDKIETEYDATLKRAFTLVKDETPEDIVYTTGGPLPWLGVANQEMVKEVAEFPGSANNPEVMKYFKATSYDAVKEDPWCGAFVAWCLKNCGNDAAAASVDTASAARAASWKSWGDVAVPMGAWDSASMPEGAIVVLSPSEGTGASGHVAFYAGKTSTHVKLLGGNQSDAVNIKEFRRSKVVAVRMLKGFDSIPAGTPGPGLSDGDFPEGAIGPLTIDDWNKYMEILGRRESNNNFRAINRLGYCGRWQFGALALIDSGYVKSGASNSKLDKNQWWKGKKGVNSRTRWLDNHDNCQFEAMIVYTGRNYKSLLNIGALKVDEPKSVLVGMLAASHLLGTGGAKKMRQGNSPTDANGVSGVEYFKLMSNAFDGADAPPAH